MINQSTQFWLWVSLDAKRQETLETQHVLFSVGMTIKNDLLDGTIHCSVHIAFRQIRQLVLLALTLLSISRPNPAAWQNF